MREEKPRRTQSELRDKGLDPGSASIRIDLHDGKIIVYHGQDGGVLKTIPEAKAGSWNKIWEVLNNL